MMVKLRILGLCLMTLALGCSVSRSAADESAAIRAAINGHLAAQDNLNTAAFDTEIQKINIQGDQAQADVAFRIKGGPGVMQLTYNLKKTGAAWAVVDSNPVGSNLPHQALDANGAPVPNPQSSSTPDIFDAIHQKMGSGPAGTKQVLPAEHPR